MPLACSAQGTYSAEGASACINCPAGQFSPTTGLGEQTTGAQKCLLCPAGSVALKEGETTAIMPTLSEGATTCDAW